MTPPTAAIVQERTKLLHFDHDHALASWESTFVIWWRFDTTQAAVDRLHTELGNFCENHVAPSVLTIIGSGAQLPPTEVRERLAAILRDHAHVVASAVVFEGTGFRAAAVRSVVTGLSLIARQPFPHRIFAEVHEAALWLAREQHKPTSEATGLIQAIEYLRSEVGSIAVPPRSGAR